MANLEWPPGWPRATSHNKPSSFRTTYAQALKALNDELRLLGGTEAVLSTNAPKRRDGTPYTEAMTEKLDDPGVAVFFKFKGQPRVMARDAHRTPLENLQSIVHAIRHLRGLERHGGAYMMDRAFAGFKALPPPGMNGNGADPFAVLGIPRGSTKDEVSRAYRVKAGKLHPDQLGGSNDAMAALNEARDRALEQAR